MHNTFPYEDRPVKQFIFYGVCVHKWDKINENRPSRGDNIYGSKVDVLAKLNKEQTINFKS